MISEHIYLNIGLTGIFFQCPLTIVFLADITLSVYLHQRNCQSGMGTLANVIETLDDIYDVMKTAGHKNGQIWVGACNTSEVYHLSIHKV